MGLVSCFFCIALFGRAFADWISIAVYDLILVGHNAAVTKVCNGLLASSFQFVPKDPKFVCW